MDLTETIAPRSDQLNADDLISGPVTVTITAVKPGAAEQPVDIVIAEFPGRAYRPSKSMRRVIVSAWGPNSNEYIGRSLTLYRDPSITFGKDAVGGIRISHLSHIDKPLKLALTVTRGKRAPFTVQPLKVIPCVDWIALVGQVESPEDGKRLWADALKAGGLDDNLKQLITARVEDVKVAHQNPVEQIDQSTGEVIPPPAQDLPIEADYDDAAWLGQEQQA